MYLEVKDLRFRYKKTEPLVLNNINFLLEQGSTLAILGESGSGKSTILRILSGLEVPENGYVSINNHVMNDHKVFVNAEKRGLGMVFQDYALFPHMNVEKNIKFGISHLSKKVQEERVIEALTLVDLLDLRLREPHELSGGQQQRIALARALATKPKLLLLDEPFSNLDAHLREKIRMDMKDILNKANITSIFVTHDESDALAISDQVMILEKGIVQKIGNTMQVLKPL